MQALWHHNAQLIPTVIQEMQRRWDHLGSILLSLARLQNAERFVALARSLTGPDISNIIDSTGWKPWKQRDKKHDAESDLFMYCSIKFQGKS